MVKITINVDSSKLQNLTEKIPQIRKKGLQYAGQGMIASLQKNSPVDHGVLKGWFFYNSSDDEIHIRSPAKYVKFVNDGTGVFGPRGTPIIHPSIGKKFAFQVGGKMIYTNVIQGQRGQHFVEKSIAETQSKLGGFFIKSVREVLQ